MRFPWANIALLLLLLLQLVTGYLGLVNGRVERAWLLWAHGMGAYGIVLLLLWKGAIVWDVLGRGKRWRPARLAFLVLALLLVVVILLGVLWTFGGLEYAFGFSLISLHIYLAVPLMILLAFHAWRMRWIWRVKRATNRRAFLRMGAVALGGAVLWWLARRVQLARRFTGSYEVGSYGGWFPRVSWINDDPRPIEAEQWQLVLDGLVRQPLRLSYEQARELAGEEMTATLDCTGGWYSTQVWRGIPLSGLLAMAGVHQGARSVTVHSVTGYWRRFSLREAEAFLLAADVAGQPLSHGHGFPLRLVAPGRRGFAWVKWVTHVTVDEVSAYWQPPLPLQ
ncbi:MAG TPA: molybdopterin-dependent oxidoreductase [Candidatus Sulfomarinibacteraceae bacterium]|nr:molybdopterin-dependent oxidoreductase [Candidatus Sulfomarinibacteraceae bacterium]